MLSNSNSSNNQNDSHENTNGYKEIDVEVLKDIPLTSSEGASQEIKNNGCNNSFRAHGVPEIEELMLMQDPIVCHIIPQNHYDVVKDVVIEEISNEEQIHTEEEMRDDKNKEKIHDNMTETVTKGDASDALTVEETSYENTTSEYVPSEEEEEMYKIEHLELGNSLVAIENNNISLQEEKEPIKHKSVFIRESSKDSFGKRVRDKRHCCYFCNKTFKEVAKHLQNKHPDEMEVAKLLALPKKSDERRKGFIYLTRIGDYYHNCEVLKRNEGELILGRLPTPEEKFLYNVHDYGPCPDCFGFFLKRHLWHHLKYSCTVKSLSQNGAGVLRRQPVAESTALIAHTFSDISCSTEFTTGIVAALKHDAISLVCRQDILIMKLAVLQFEKYHNTQNDLIRQTMRQLGRLLIELRRMNETKKWLADWLHHELFDSVITAVKILCRSFCTSRARPKFTVPSLALKLGYSLKKCVAIQKGIFLRSGNIEGVKQLKLFLSLMDMEWESKISSNALATLNDRKINSTELLPLTDDLVKLNEFLNAQLGQCKSDLKKLSNYKNWNNLAAATLCKIILFNKRRSGEASRMTLLQYSSRPNWSNSCAKEFQNTFSPLELQLASKLTMVQIKGKRGKTVTVLLTDDVKEAVDLLLLDRAKFVSLENPFIFARSQPSLDHIRGHDCIRNVTTAANLSQPDLINGTNLRKYIATVCQIFNLTENETDWLARHLGHDIRVHRQFYRLHESSIELTKVSRLLLAVEKGDTNQFRGKKLDEINIWDLPDLDVMENVDNLGEEGNVLANKEKDKEENQESIFEAREISDIDTEEADTEEEYLEDKLVETKGNKGVTNKRKKENNPLLTEKSKNTKRHWTDEECTVVLTYFRQYIKKQREIGKGNCPPGKIPCEECIQSNKVILKNRCWRNVKYFVYNYMTKINKKKNSS